MIIYVKVKDKAEAEKVMNKFIKAAIKAAQVVEFVEPQKIKEDKKKEKGGSNDE